MSLVEQFFESQNSNRRIVHAIARSMSVDADEVESAVLYRLLTHAESDGQPFTAILRARARQCAIDVRRHAMRRPAVSLSATVQDAAGDDVSAVPEPGTDDTTFARLVAREALQTLTRGERRAILGHASDASSRVLRSKAKAKVTKFMAGR